MYASKAVPCRSALHQPLRSHLHCFLVVSTLCTWQVDPPKGAGASHDRKLKSYLAEAAFYSHHAAAAAGAACAVAQPLLVDVSLPRHFFFLMSDLSEAFPEQPHSYSLQVRCALRCTKLAVMRSSIKLPKQTHVLWLQQLHASRG
jgi:hypothetical protein